MASTTITDLKAPTKLKGASAGIGAKLASAHTLSSTSRREFLESVSDSFANPDTVMLLLEAEDKSFWVELGAHWAAVKELAYCMAPVPAPSEAPT